MSEGNEKAERRIRKYNIKTLTFLISFIVLLTLGNVTSTVAKTKKISMNYSVIRMTKGYSMKLKVKGTKKKIKWFSSNKKIATVEQGVVTAHSVGTCTIVAKLDVKEYACQVTVTDLKNSREILK